KSGVRGFAFSLRKEANPLGIRVSLLEPGSIGTEMVDESPERQREMQEELKMLSADDVARAEFYVLSQPERCDVVQLQLRPHIQIVGNTMKRSFGYGLLGAGGFGRFSLGAYMKMPDLHCLAVADSNPAAASRLAGEFGIDACNSAAELFARPDIDIVHL